MVQLPPAVARAAKAFGLDTGSLRELGGNSGSAWGAGNRVLRVGRPAVIDAELAASSAVAAVVPVPAVLDRARTWTILTLDPAARARRGEPGWAALCQGWIQAGRLHDIPAAHRAWACAFMLSDLAGRYPNAMYFSVIGWSRPMLRRSAW